MKILIFTTSEGHRSIAEAVHAYLDSNGFKSKICFLEEPGLTFYRFIYKHSPQSFWLFFKLSYTKLADIFLKKILLQEHYSNIRNEILENKPQIVVSTSFGFTPTLEKIKKEFPDIKFINIIPNPRSFFYQDIADSAETNCIFDTDIENQIKKVKPHAKTLITGWFVRPEFVFINKTKAKQDLKLDPNISTFLIVAGSEGSLKIVHTVESLITSAKPLNIIVACGHNQELITKIKNLFAPEHILLQPIPFTKEIYKYMQAADLIIGKAGPNMIFEAVACHTPFFATTHVGGLEDGNLEIIHSYHIGLVEENATKANKTLHNLTTNPNLLKQFMPNIIKLSKFNQVKRENLLKKIQTFQT